MPVMPVGAHRIIDIADVSASQGALWICDAGYAGRGRLHYGHRRSRKRVGKPRDTVRLISWMCSVVCPVPLDEVNGIEHVVFDVFFGGTIAYAELRAALVVNMTELHGWSRSITPYQNGGALEIVR